VDDNSQRRIAFAHQYHDGLADLDDELILPPLRSDGSHTYTYYPVQFRDRHALVRHLMKEGCDLAVQHLKNCADMECFADFRRECVNARATASEAILLPTYPRYGRDDVARNINAIRTFFGRRPVR
jgi:dTDP-4-amino-4,6-dideoxygalactose transaminase